MISGLSLNLIVYNEAHRIRQFLEQTLPLVDEAVIVDQSSTDGTPEIIQEIATASGKCVALIHDDHHGFAEPSRNLALGYTHTPWVLSLDADEHLDPAFAAELRDLDRHLQIRTRVGAVIAGEVINISQPRFKLFRTQDFYYLPQLHTSAIPKEVLTASMGRWDFPGVGVWDTKDWTETLVGLEQYEALGWTAVSWLEIAREHGLKGEDLDAMTPDERHALGFLPLP